MVVKVEWYLGSWFRFGFWSFFFCYLESCMFYFFFKVFIGVFWVNFSNICYLYSFLYFLSVFIFIFLLDKWVDSKVGIIILFDR